MKTIKSLKRFGLNYLFDLNIINKIVAEINPEPNDNIIEIGPGHGSLTEKLLEKTDIITAIEIDKRRKGNKRLRDSFRSAKIFCRSKVLFQSFPIFILS